MISLCEREALYWSRFNARKVSTRNGKNRDILTRRYLLTSRSVSPPPPNPSSHLHNIYRYVLSPLSPRTYTDTIRTIKRLMKLPAGSGGRVRQDAFIVPGHPVSSASIEPVWMHRILHLRVARHYISSFVGSRRYSYGTTRCRLKCRRNGNVHPLWRNRMYPRSRFAGSRDRIEMDRFYRTIPYPRCKDRKI